MGSMERARVGETLRDSKVNLRNKNGLDTSLYTTHILYNSIDWTGESHVWVLAASLLGSTSPFREGNARVRSLV